MVIALVGNQGEGKSEFCKQYIKRSSKPFLYYYKPNSEDFFKAEVKPGYIYCVDDAQSYLPLNPQDKRVKNVLGLLSQRRWKELTFFFCFHSFPQVPPWLITYIDRYVVYKNELPAGSHQLNKAIKQVNNMPPQSFVIV